ncbi:putative transcription factor interactor and regulator CCHC(Zn) family [Helianthus annuus]|nr:putative transcription factor interactor and regulator CCHC(Zn) family [Helianthus annuus]
MISHIKACELDDKQREINHKNSLLAAGFITTPSSSNNVALTSQAGLQMFKSLTSAKATQEPASANVIYPTAPSSSSFNAAAASSVKNEFIAFFSQQTKENLEIAASIVNCLNAFVAGDLTPPNFVMSDLDLMHPDDVEEMYITWQMAMVTFRTKNFVKRTGKNSWTNSGDRKVGIDKSKIRCFNCHEPGHLARNCTKPPMNKKWSGPSLRFM